MVTRWHIIYKILYDLIWWNYVHCRSSFFCFSRSESSDSEGAAPDAQAANGTASGPSPKDWKKLKRPDFSIVVVRCKMRCWMIRTLDFSCKMIDKMIRPLDFSEIARSMIKSYKINHLTVIVLITTGPVVILLVQDLWLQLCLAPVGRWGLSAGHGGPWHLQVTVP